MKQLFHTKVWMSIPTAIFNLSSEYWNLDIGIVPQQVLGTDLKKKKYKEKKRDHNLF